MGYDVCGCGSDENAQISREFQVSETKNGMIIQLTLIFICLRHHKGENERWSRRAQEEKKGI